MKKRMVIYADENKILTNGEIYGKLIYLADGVDASAFYEISLEEYQKLQESSADANLES